tara:strand:+ start:249 stop:425 length:177 start_codon:yes stop_codon:yes gene_type:complete
MKSTTSSPDFTNIYDIIDKDLNDSDKGITKQLLEKYKPRRHSCKPKPIKEVIDLREAA